MDPGPVEIVNRMIRLPVALVRYDLDGIGIDSIGERPETSLESCAFPALAWTLPRRRLSGR